MAIIGQQPSRAYGFDGYVNVFPFPIVTTRAPVNGDDGGVNGQMWIDTTGQDAYTMVDSASSIWINAGGGAGLFASLTVNPGPVAIDSTLTTITATANVANVFQVVTGGAAGTTSTFAITNGTGTAANALALTATAGGVLVDGRLATVDAIHLNANTTAGSGINIDANTAGVDVDTSGQINLNSTQNAATAIVVESTAGGIQILASGAIAGEDIVVTATGSSIRLVSTEDIADSIVLSSTNGGIDILAPGAAAGEDIDIIATGSSVNINSTEDIANSIVISSTNGGIDILALGAAAGEDIDIIATGSSVNIQSTENAASAIFINTNGGVAETIVITNTQGTAVDAIGITATAGGVSVKGDLNTVDAIHLECTDPAGGINVDAGTAGLDLDTSGPVSLTSTFNDASAIVLQANGGALEKVSIASAQGTDAASVSLGSQVGGIVIETAANQKDINLSAVDGSINILAGEVATDAVVVQATNGSVQMSGGQNAASAVLISASHATGGITLDAGPTPGVTLTNGTQTAQILVGTGSPDTAVTAAQGSIFLNVAGGADTILYVNTNGITAWTALTST